MFTVFIAIAMSFVSWLIYAVFSQSYREIKQQYYGVVSRQIVEDIENSIRNGKQIERFYGMDKVLGDMLGLISTEQVPINTAITDINGSVLYNSYSDSDRKEEYNALLLNENVMYNISFDGEGSSAFRIADAGEYEVMIQPIYDREGSQIGAMTLFYRLADIEQELLPQKQRSDMVTMACIGATILLLVIYFVVLPRSICEVGKNSAPDSVEELRRKQHENKFLFVIPVLAIMVGLLVQCVIAYNEYQKRYKDVMFEGAVGISSYIGEIINDLYEKGVDYDRMNGLPEYLAVKVEDSPLLWNVSVVNVYADTADILTRSSEYNVSLKISGDDSLNTFINVEISKEYIDEKMLGMLLVFAVTFAVALIMIFELLKLPDAMFTRISRNFRQSETVQAGAVAPVLRLGAFIAYTGMYVGIPFSSVLITQWNKSVLGFSVPFLASIPMTAELLATMLCSLFLLPVYRRMDLKLLFSVSAVISALANVLCFFSGSPESLILLRFVSGIGFAGIKYSLNSIVSLGSLTPENTTSNLAALNAGLLGGITCGGTLGAVIASSVNVHTSYFIAGVFIFAFVVAVLALSPWKLFRSNNKEPAGKPPRSILPCIQAGFPAVYCAGSYPYEYRADVRGCVFPGIRVLSWSAGRYDFLWLPCERTGGNLSRSGASESTFRQDWQDSLRGGFPGTCSRVHTYPEHQCAARYRARQRCAAGTFRWIRDSGDERLLRQHAGGQGSRRQPGTCGTQRCREYCPDIQPGAVFRYPGWRTCRNEHNGDRICSGGGTVPAYYQGGF